MVDIYSSVAILACTSCIVTLHFCHPPVAALLRMAIIIDLVCSLYNGSIDKAVPFCEYYLYVLSHMVSKL